MVLWQSDLSINSDLSEDGTGLILQKDGGLENCSQGKGAEELSPSSRRIGASQKYLSDDQEVIRCTPAANLPQWYHQPWTGTPSHLSSHKNLPFKPWWLFFNFQLPKPASKV